jgi:Cytochrome c554 and c-prime
MAHSIKKTLVLCMLMICAVICSWGPHGQGQMQQNDPLTKWRPTRDYSGIGYVGSSVCAKCHASKARTQLATPMARALETTADCQILITRPRLTFRNGPYSYQITRQGDRSIYTVSDGVNTISEPILYCFGQGVAGQTYIFRHNGSLYESRVSYFQELKNLDITILHPRAAPASLGGALGRPMSAEAAQGCFSCHSTAAVSGSQLQLGRLTPGISCEACHGPGEKHVAAVNSGSVKDLQIFNPKKLDALDLSQEFCGSCHQSFDKVMLMPGQGGINNIRFQPYRIFNSRGHMLDDRRISCVACHDPHDKLEHEASFYDSKCFACHLSSPKEARTEARMASACPVSAKQCVTCHMPKVEVPDMHFKFTDHWIRVVKPNDPIPN